MSKAIVTLLCGVGLYASLFMLAKTRRAARGELAEPSVVASPRARLFGGVPNALLGGVYYPALAAAIWFVPPTPILAGAILAVVGFAAATSLVLAYSLLFVTRRPCPYCWTAHAINWSLAWMCFAIFKSSILFSSG
ncbi:MAG: vitamin K epoxide reductase family protein [Candidatus Tumulicola sp.]